MKIKSIEKEERELSKKIAELSDYIKSGNKKEDENILKMQLFQMMQYRDLLKKRLSHLK